MKPCIFIGSSLRDLREFPADVRAVMGAAIQTAQYGGKATSAKPLKGLGSGVFEIVESYDGNAYRGVYIVRFDTAIYILHAFVKKSTTGIKTAQRDIEMIKARIKIAEEHHAGRQG
jgi:phage-related protein